MYVILGATGNTGKPLALALLAAGKKVRAVSRNADKAQDLAAKGAEIVSANLTDVAALTKAFEGATAVYALLPPNYQSTDMYGHQMETSDSIAEALEAAKVPNVVTLSSVGAHMTEGAGVVQGLHYMENRFNQIAGANVLHLRPGYFFENHLGGIGMLKGMGALGGAMAGDMPISMIATADIAAYAAKRLLALDFQGKGVQFLLGPRDYTMREAAEILGNAVGKPGTQYMQFPYEAAQAAMINDWGLSASVAERMIEFNKAANEGKLGNATVRDAEASTPTSLEDFAKTTFAYVYNM
jgi:uncharacterized protein YbjT (DUF2867 family)